MSEIQLSDYTLDSILENVSTVSKISIDTLKSKLQKRKISEARHAYFILSKQLTKCTLQVIGNKVGNRDHATVLWGIKQSHIPEIKHIVKTVKTIYYEQYK